MQRPTTDVWPLWMRLASSLLCAAGGAVVFLGALYLAVMGGLSAPSAAPAVVLLGATFAVPLLGVRWMSAIPVVASIGAPAALAYVQFLDLGSPGGTWSNLVATSAFVFGTAWAGGRVGLAWKRRAMRGPEGQVPMVLS